MNSDATPYPCGSGAADHVSDDIGFIRRPPYTAVDLIRETKELSELSRSYAEFVSENISDRENDARSMCFWNIHNRVRITEEILSFYIRSWDLQGIDMSDEDLGNEMTERVITVTKDLFVDVVSMIEKTSKETVDLYPGTGIRKKALDNRNFLYLRNIIEATCGLGIISETEFREWDDILVMRNLAAHNNSVSDRSKRFRIADITISMRPGRMMKGPVDTFIVLSGRITDLFYGWLRKVHDLSFSPRPS
jgi:hypothetical protein